MTRLLIIGTICIITNENGEDLPPNVAIDGEPIQFRNSTRYLGVQIDTRLKWKDHISMVSCKVVHMIGYANRARTSYLKKPGKCYPWNLTVDSVLQPWASESSCVLLAIAGNHSESRLNLNFSEQVRGCGRTFIFTSFSDIFRRDNRRA